MSNRLKSFAIATLVFSLTFGVGLAANDVVVKHTLAQTAASSDRKAEADKLFQEGVQQYRRGEYPKALQTYQRVLEIRQQLADKAGEAATLNNKNIATVVETFRRNVNTIDSNLPGMILNPKYEVEMQNFAFLQVKNQYQKSLTPLPNYVG